MRIYNEKEVQKLYTLSACEEFVEWEWREDLGWVVPIENRELEECLAGQLEWLDKLSLQRTQLTMELWERRECGVHFEPNNLTSLGSIVSSVTRGSPMEEEKVAKGWKLEAEQEGGTIIIKEEESRPTCTSREERAFTREVAKMVKGVLKVASSISLEVEDALVGTELSGLMGILAVSSLSGVAKQATISAMWKTLMEQLSRVGNQGGIGGAANPIDSEASGGSGDIASLGQGAL